MSAIRWLLVAVSAAASMVCCAVPAYAGAAPPQPPPSTYCDTQSSSCSVDASATAPQRVHRGSSSAGRCYHDSQPVACQTGDGRFDSSSGCYLRVVDPGSVPAGPVLVSYEKAGGSIAFADCPFGGSGGYLWRPPAKPVVTAATVRARVERLLPSAQVGLAPKAATLVNIQTVMWARTPPSRTLPVVRVLDQRVAITLVADAVDWRFGDGSEQPRGPLGTAYDGTGHPCRSRVCPGYFGHVYARRGAVRVSARVVWRVSFRVDGGRLQQVDGDVDGPAATASLQVREARAVLVANP